MDYAGIDTDTIVSQLMALERRPLAVLEARKKSAQDTSIALGKINSAVEAIGTAAAKLKSAGAYDRFAATVSNSSAVSASAGSGATAGSLTFTVTRVAGTHGLRSTGALASSADQIADAGALLAVGVGAGAVGISRLTTGDGSAAAIRAATGVTGPVDITAANDSFTLIVGGQARTISIAAGSYADAGELASAVENAVTLAGVTGVSVGVDGGHLTFTAEAGTSLGVGGGTAAAALGLTGTTASGGAYVLDSGGFQTVFASAPAPGAAIAASADGTRNVRIADAGSGSLADVAAAISGAGGSVTAAAVNTGSGWTLQLSSSLSGVAGAISIGADVFTAAAGTFQETGTAQDAQIVVGAGTPGEYTITGDGNSFADVLAGVTFSVHQLSSEPVTVSVARNDAAIAGDVDALVKQVNAVLADIKVQTFWNQQTKTGGPLLGQSAVRRLASDLTGALNGVVGDYATGLLPSSAGIEIQKDGTFTFDRARFLEALADDPARVAALFVGTDDAPGVAARVAQVATDVTRTGAGLLATTGEAVTDRIARFTTQIEQLEDRLLVRETNLYRQWSSLQSMLAGLQQQGSWLQSQLATLPTIER